MDHNPYLAFPSGADEEKGSDAGIERPGAVVNIAWQTRAAPPTAAEGALADALQALFAADVVELPAIVEGLNHRRVAAPGGAARWTEDLLCAELSRLGR